MKIVYALLLSACALPALQAQPAAPPEHGPTYRLTYTVTESDGQKRLGVQHFSLTVTAGAASATLKLGSKVPVTTGSYQGGNNPVQSQFTYLDVGLNLRARLSLPANGTISLDSQVEQSSVTDSIAMNSDTVHEPVIRQAVLQNTAELTPGKPVMLGSLDTPGSTRHLDVEVVLEPVK